MNSPNFWNSSRDSLAAYGEYSHELTRRNAKQPYIPVNALGSALSPYLRSHAQDPVGWQEWTPAAFEAALREDRPLFVSAGYHGSHWCNVMARECWRDTEVAGLLNNAFIPVLVDIQERPDVNTLLTEVCRLQAGKNESSLSFFPAPLTAFLDGEGHVFFAATWLPKRTMGEVPGITELLPRVKWLWHMQSDDIDRSAIELHTLFTERISSISGSKRKISIKHSPFEAVSDLRKVFNLKWGGWGNTPKFPQYPALIFLLEGAKSGKFSALEKSDALTMTDITLRRMWRGGIHDHLGGGFHHYSVDERWQVPHFEKLLYEQALMLLAASLMEEIDPKPFNRLLAEDMIFCALHDFAAEETYSQGFKASIDGDVLAQSDSEGKYYLWAEDEIKHILPENDAGLFCSAYGVLPGGNFSPEFGGSHMGQNILYEASTVTELAKRYGIRPPEVGDKLTQSRKLLFDARTKRYSLSSDSKILMGWNGLMIGALSRASVSFDVSEWRDLAERSALFLYKNLQDKNGNFYRCWHDGNRWGNAQCEDYAYFLWGIIELYKACKHFNAGEKQLGDWLKNAHDLADTMLAKLWHEDLGGLFMTADNTVSALRLKYPEDTHSLPNANAFAAIALSELGEILQEKSYSDKARNIIDCFSRYALDNPLSCMTFLTANTLWKPVKKKPEIPPAPPVSKTAHLSDEELNAPEPSSVQQETPRAARHAASSQRTEHSDAAARRRSPRASRRRER